MRVLVSSVESFSLSAKQVFISRVNSSFAVALDAFIDFLILLEIFLHTNTMTRLNPNDVALGISPATYVKNNDIKRTPVFFGNNAIIVDDMKVRICRDQLTWNTKHAIKAITKDNNSSRICMFFEIPYTPPFIM